tara:strand:+ start:105 stop:467 length:363 start_codon:yes stop_codon:yes gene_type:complete
MTGVVMPGSLMMMLAAMGGTPMQAQDMAERPVEAVLTAADGADVLTVRGLSPVAVSGSYELDVVSGARSGNHAVQKGRIHLAANRPATFVTLRVNQFRTARLRISIDGQPPYEQAITPER